MCNITIDNQHISVEPGITVLQAAKTIGITIPTLCFLEGHEGIGACRVCVVEIEGSPRLVAACSTPVREGMEIKTHTKRVREARRTVVSLLLSEHQGNCQTCERNDDCELKKLAKVLGIDTLDFEQDSSYPLLDESTPALIRDPGKCIKCRRCVTVCNEVQGVHALFPQYRGYASQIAPAFSLPLDSVACVQCGQCAAVCPVGAIVEKSHIQQVWEALENPDLHVVVQTAPAIRAALGETSNLPPGTLVTGRMVTALRRLGFDKVFDTNFTADLTILEEGTELLTRLKKHYVLHEKTALPQLSSCSPGWINFAEYYYPDFLPNLSTAKSPQQMFGAIAKTYYASKAGIAPENIRVVSVMPCTAKKFEAARSEMRDSGYQDVDYVLTTRELGRMIESAGLNLAELPEDTMDSPLGLSTGAADIFANTGGVMEAALRTVYAVVTGRELPTKDLHIQEIAGLEGIKKVTLPITETVKEWKFLEGVDIQVAVAHGLGNAAKILDRIQTGKEHLHFVELMACPGGCIGGGGQPRFTTDEIRKARMAAIFKEDEGKTLRQSHLNPDIELLYKEFLKEPLGEISHHLLHTAYKERDPSKIS